MGRWKKALALCLIVSVALVSTYFLMLDKSQFFQFSSASLSFELQNESSRSLNVSFFLYAGTGRFEFNGTKTSKLHGNFSVWEISDGSGIEVDYYSLAPSDHLGFVIEEIEITPLLHSIRDTDLKVSFTQGNESDFSYNSAVSLLNDQGISILSRYYHTVRLNQGTNYLRYEDRATSPIYLNVLIAVMTTFFIGVGAIMVWHKARLLPIISVFILLVTLALYVFLGSGFEINGRNWWWLFPLSVFVHGSDWHIIGNLVYFMILSVLFELFLKMKAQWLRRDMTIWYFLPLFIPIIVYIPNLFGNQQFGFGLSYSIEIMTWTLWAYIISHYHELIKNRICLLMAILSGIPSFTFLGWVVSFSFGFSSDPYDSSLAVGHIVVGILSGIVVLLIVFGHDIRQELKKRFHSHLDLQILKG
jgi:hypothetical protein